jgi:50S ribosomal protein L16 3-hydroxylase
MTYSIGFRAPSRADLVEGWSVHQADGMAEEDRYADPDLTPQLNPGEISSAAFDRMHAMVMEALSDRDAFARWFGLHHSLPKYADADWQPDEPIALDEVLALLTQGKELRRNPASRYSFIRREPSILLFVDGHCFDCGDDTAPLAEKLCSASTFAPDQELTKSAGSIALIKALIDQGSLAFDEEG